MKPPNSPRKLILLIASLFSFFNVYLANSQGNGLDFSGGSDDIVVVPDDASLEMTGDFTIEFWLNTSVVGNNIILEKGTGNSEYSIQQSSSNTIILNINGIMQTNGTYNDGTWHHVAVVYRGSGNGTIYVDGIDDTNGTNGLGTPSYSTGTLTMGNRSGSSSLSIEGILDEVRIWDDERTQEEVIENMFGVLAGGEGGLVSYYNFDASSGTTLTDQEGSNDGTLTNMTGSEWTAAAWDIFTANAAIIQEGGSDVSTGISGELTLTDVGFLNDDGDFLLAGHEGSAFSEVTTDLPAGSVVSARYNRNWHVTKNDESGTANGDVTLSFDLGATPTSNNSYYLLTRSGTSGNFSVVSTIGSTNGNSVEFTIDASVITSGNYYTVGRATASVLLNELIITPRQDWSAGNFYNPSPGGSEGSNDEWVELYVLQSGIDLTGWTIELNDGSDESGTLAAGGAFATSNYLSTSGGSFTNTDAGDYLILGNMSSGAINATGTTTVNLKNAAGEIIDQVVVAISGGTGFSGNSTNTSDESVSRIPGESDTNDHDADWSKTIATLGTTNSPTGIVKINEVVTDPFQDWNSIGFSGSPPGGTGADNDEWIELYVETAGINLTGWTISMIDGSDRTGTLETSGDGVFNTVNYVSSGSGVFTNTAVGDYIILGDPTGDMNNDVLIVLYNASGNEVDRVQLGGAAGQAPSGVNSSAAAESISRYTNATDTDTDDVDFTQTIASLGSTNSPTGVVVINEVVTDPQQDWDANSFSGIVGSGTPTGSDEWIELYIADAGINLTGWTMTIEDPAPDFTNEIITTAGPFGDAVYFSSGGGTFERTAAGDYYVLGNATGDMTNSPTITLRNASGNIVDQVTLGGGAGEAPSGNATNISDESISRIPNATDTNADDADFAQAQATLGAENFVTPLPTPGYGLEFDGDNDFVTVADSDDFSFGDGSTDSPFSVEAWINLNSTGSMAVFTKRDGSDYEYQLTTYTNGIIMTLWDESAAASAFRQTVSTPLSTSQWYHIAYVYDGTDADGITLYINGVDVSGPSTTNVGYVAMENTDAQVEIGSIISSINLEFDGIMDELRVWDDVRTHEEILENMFTTLTGSESNLVAYYDFDQTTGTSLPDRAGSNDGTLNNMDNSDWVTTNWDSFSANESIVDPTTGADVTSGASDQLTVDESAFLNDDGDFILAGHENSDFTEVTTDLPSGTLVTARYDRSWHLLVNDETGTTGGNVTLSFNLGTTPNSNATYYLLTRATSSGNFSIVPVIGVNPSGNNVVFTVDAASLVDNNYYTIGRSDAGVGNALDFDDTSSDYVELANPTTFDFGTNDYTVEMWVNVDDGTGIQVLAGDFDGSTNDEFTLWIGGNAVATSAGSGAADITTGSVITNGSWHHVAIVRNSGQGIIYVDGVAEATNTLSGSISSSSNMNLGRQPGGSPFHLDGRLDEVRFWNDARSQEELVDNMFSNLTGIEANLVAYYRANQGIGNSDMNLPDLSGDNNNGTLTNFNNLGGSMTTSNWVTSDRTVFSSIAFIINTGIDVLTDVSDELTISSTASAGDYLQDTDDQVIWGNDGGAFTEETNDLPSGTLVTARMTKTWNIDKNDEVGTAHGNLTFSFNLGSAPNPDYTYYLLTRTGTSGDFSIVEAIGSEPNGNSIEFTVDGVEITDLNYFTLGRSDSGPGNALDFDGTDDNVTVADPGVTFGTALTVEAWVNIPGSETAGSIVSHFDENGPHFDGFSFEMGTGTSGVMSFFCNDASGSVTFVDESTSTTINDGTWHHIAAVYDGSNISFYLDGVLLSSPTAPHTSIGAASNNLYIARDANPSINRPLDAQIDEVRIWSDVRTASEIEDNMHRSLDVSDAGNDNLVAYYKFDQGDAGGTNTGVDLLTDHSGNDNAGTLTNMALSGSSSNWVTSEAVAYDAATNQPLIGAGNALDFDGGDDFVTVPDDATLRLSAQGTLEVWVQADLFTTESGSERRLIKKGGSNSNSNSPYQLDLATDQTVHFIIGDGSMAVGYQSVSTLTTGWHHIVVTWDGTNVLIYIDGVLDASLTQTTAPIASNTEVLELGRTAEGGTSGHFDGQLDEVRIWNTVRTDTEIQDNMFEELVGNETGLVAYYRFDEFADAGNTTLSDQTANGNDGTLTNMDPANDWVDATPRDAFKTTNAGTWDGSTTSTWKNGSPPNAATHKLNVGHNITMDFDADVLDLNINSGTTMTINSGRTLTVNGNLINNGTISGDGTVLLNTGSPIITGGTVSNLEIGGGITSTLQGSSTVSSSLSLTNGLISLGEFDLTLSSGASVTRTDDTDYIQTINQNASGGALRMEVANGAGEITFPVGTSTYTPFTMANLGTTSNFSVRVFDGHYLGGTSGNAIGTDLEIDRTWVVDASGSGFNTTITIQWNVGEEDASFDRANMFISRNGPRGWWEPISGTIAASGSDPYTASVSGVTSFSEISGGSGSTPLPVKLVAFDARENDRRVELTWTTATELNNDYFEIQRSQDGETFVSIGEVDGSGDSEELLTYAFTDAKPGEGMNYYRLKQVDFDGSSELSEIRMVQLIEAFENQLEVFPNPSSAGFTVRLYIPDDEVLLSIVDISGRTIQRSVFDTSQPVQINFGERLKTGVYMLIAETSQGKLVSRIVKE